jgi:CO/xanthine dehydrogenase FAD-binding subunit
MCVLAPTDVDGVLAALGAEPDAELLAGGTDFMVEVNAGHRRPRAVVSLHRVDELRGWRRDGDEVVLGAGLTYTAMEDPALVALHPALAASARTVGSPQIRNAGTLGGNVGTASPAGDTLPVLAALDAVIELRGADGTRSLPWTEFFAGVKRTARRPDEVITAVRLPVLDSAQDYLKVGTRNAMVISVAGLALVVDFTHRSVRCALGSVGPVPLRATAAEEWVAPNIDWDARRVPDPRTYETFGALVADAARPIDDHRSTAAYRRHAIGVLARRALMRLL